MKKSVDLIKLISILLLLVVFVSEYYSNIPAIASFILVFGMLSTRYELQDASIIAIIFSSIVVMLISYFNQNVEGFDGTGDPEVVEIKKKKKKKRKRKIRKKSPRKQKKKWSRKRMKKMKY